MSDRRALVLALSMLGSPTACAKDYDRFTFESESSASGSGGQTVEVSCGGESCDVAGDLHCCVAENGATSGTCRTGCAAGEADLACDQPDDCLGSRCCLVLDGAAYQRSRCQPVCAGGLEVCDPTDGDACNGGACNAVANLPAGFHACE